MIAGASSHSHILRQVKKGAQGMRELNFCIVRLEAQLAVKAWCLDEPQKTPNKAEEEAGKLRVSSGRGSVRDWVTSGERGSPSPTSW